MKFEDLKKIIYNESNNNKKTFEESSEYIQNKIFNLNSKDLIPLVKNIGIIPESIVHDSSEEKLYAKTADILLAKTFQEMGLYSNVITERANCADVVAKSKIHNYFLVGVYLKLNFGKKKYKKYKNIRKMKLLQS